MWSAAGSQEVAAAEAWRIGWKAAAAISRRLLRCLDPRMPLILLLLSSR